ncbi:O-antigen ligase family protein [Streptomyces sp. NPDC051913]|uniref:O-antigen ligase family protein n=1 Tax=Streptomyces sp. NPDC051913 TaxID=3365676 RepID=UPI0037D8A105
MPQDQANAVFVLGILALLSLVPWTVALRRAHAHGDWDATSSLVFLTGVLANLPTVVYVLHTGRPQRLDPLGEVVIGFPQWVNALGVAANGLLVVACGVFLLHRLLVARADINTAPLVALALVVLVALSDGLRGGQLLAPRQLVLIAVLLAATAARPGRSALLGGAAVVMLITVLGGVEGLAEPRSVVRECRADNPCGPLGVLYSGVFTNENIFGLLLVVGLPFVWLGLRGSVRAVLTCYVAFVAVATGSRLAGATAVAVVAFLLVLRPRLRHVADRSAASRTSGSPGALLLGVPVLAAAAAVGLALPFLHLGVDRLGDRATVWGMAAQELRESPFIGFGAKAWSAKYQAGEIPAALSPSLHNQWMDVLYAGGLAGLALFLLLLVHLLVRGGTAGFSAAACLLLPVLLASVLERPWSFGISNSLTFALLTAVLAPVAARRGVHEVAPGSASSPADVPARTPRRSPAATATDHSALR